FEAPTPAADEPDPWLDEILGDETALTPTPVTDPVAHEPTATVPPLPEGELPAPEVGLAPAVDVSSPEPALAPPADSDPDPLRDIVDSPALLVEPLIAEPVPEQSALPVGSWDPSYDDIIPGKVTAAAAGRSTPLADQTVAAAIETEAERRRPRRGRRAVDDAENPVVEPQSSRRRRARRREVDTASIDSAPPENTLIDQEPSDEDTAVTLPPPVGLESPTTALLEPPSPGAADPSPIPSAADPVLLPPPTAEPAPTDEAMPLAPPNDLPTTDLPIADLAPVDLAPVDLPAPDLPALELPGPDALADPSPEIEATEPGTKKKDRRRGLLGRRSADDARNEVRADSDALRSKGRRRKKRRYSDSELSDAALDTSEMSAAEIMGLAPEPPEEVAALDLPAPGALDLPAPENLEALPVDLPAPQPLPAELPLEPPAAPLPPPDLAAPSTLQPPSGLLLTPPETASEPKRRSFRRHRD
ncbi:MAG: hypothetical protein P8N02_02600, partial [Actinomycetota bacterium]|nr:hypothetical protein [Actinomycetota bacterium]